MRFKPVTFVVLAFMLVACSSNAQAPNGNMLPPNYAIQPVEQDAPWAVAWWRSRHDEKLELATSVDADLLMVGDSITHGWENAGAEVWQEYYADRNAFNLGFSGDRTEHVLWRLQHGAVDGMTPKLVVIMIGTNNTGHRMDPAAYAAEGIEHIVAELRQRLPMSRILLLGIFPRHYSPYNDMRQRNEEINELISSLDDGSAVHYLDINHAFLDEDMMLRDQLMPDLLHPNAAGYRVWAEAMEPAIVKLLR
jgi:beta-glucosidase